MFDRLKISGIVPVIALEDESRAVPLGKALLDGGIPVAEITFRTAAAANIIRRLTAELPDLLVGAGTVLTTAQADDAASAGAKFLVAPGLNPRVVEHAQNRGLPIIPGCATPSDIERALELGLDTVKFFPAEQAGGLNYIKAVAAPYRGVKFLPTGGINAANLQSYLKFDRVIAVGGSWMICEDLERVTSLCREAVRLVKEVRA
ncbi:hypothetical protein FACS1894217_07670 [Clostridia bacterium]|nr:hypothetical protein FACS1894217_07670 [Clostridia bacterium]